jgi:phytanoyl-CoA hydroxylase
MIDSHLQPSLGLSVAANRLSEREVASWHCNGFLVLNEVLTSEDVALLRQAMDACGLTHEIEKATTQVMHLDLTTLHPVFLALARDQHILGHVVPLIGPDIAIEHTKLFA